MTITPVRISIILLVMACAIAFAGCTYTRNAPLLQSQIEVHDTANGNTVPLVGP